MRAPLALAALTLVGAGLPLGANAGAAAPLCQGHEATIVSSGPFVQGTEGDDVIVVSKGSSELRVEARGGDDLICASYSVTVSGGAGEDSFVARTGPKADRVRVLDTEKLDVSTGGGFDEIELYGVHGTGSIDGGGRGAILKPYGDDDVLVDLEDRLLMLDGGAGEYVVKRVTRIAAHASHVTVFGDRKDNRFAVVACSAKLVGGAGDDIMMARNDTMYDCPDPGVTMYGLKGNDRMLGTVSDDRLVGGPGYDKAHGGRGDDRCVAEKMKDCER